MAMVSRVTHSFSNPAWLLGSGLVAILALALSGCESETIVGTGSKSPPPEVMARLQQESSAAIANGLVNAEPNDQVPNREAYDAIEENRFFHTLDQPQSTFAIDVDTASYANVRRMVRDGLKPPKGAVRLEELVNYFPYEYDEPMGDHPFSVSTELSTCPWNSDHQLLRVALKGRSLDTSDRKGCNLVFLIDVSGSMGTPDKLPLVKSSLRMLVDQLTSRDRIAIVVYAGASGLVLNSTPGNESVSIARAIDALESGGSTNGGAGIQLAYQVARAHQIEGGVNRVLLCTDGDFNVGVTSDSALVDLIQQQAKSNVFLSVLGFGTGNVRDSTMEKLADKGNGNYAYIDSMLEARKVLVEEVNGTLVTIAKDVKIQLDFNPLHVASHRLLGYENRKLENRDFRDDKKDAGEIGAGHTVTAFYELIPIDGSSIDDNVRKSEFVDLKPSANGDPSTMLTVNLRYKQPTGESADEFQVRVAKDSLMEKPSMDFLFASSVLAYGMLLRDSEYTGNANWDWVISTAQASVGKDPTGLRSEFVQLAKSARRMAR